MAEAVHRQASSDERPAGSCVGRSTARPSWLRIRLPRCRRCRRADVAEIIGVTAAVQELQHIFGIRVLGDSLVVVLPPYARFKVTNVHPVVSGVELAAVTDDCMEEILMFPQIFENISQTV
ncbi:hypothetical protein HYQ46_008969 [Verticillium longisporum]|nr:hypothetical protein HYQ46_008969 [Verticillium longisporum]